MRVSPRRGSFFIPAVAVGVALLGMGGRALADGPSAVVAVLAPHDSRLADEIRSELESSKFDVLSADLGGRPWQEVARAVDGGHLFRGVAVEPNDRTLTVYTRQTGADAIDTRLVLSVNPADRMARRHACLSVVEFLHALSESEPTAPVPAGPPPTASAAKSEATKARAGRDGTPTAPPPTVVGTATVAPPSTPPASAPVTLAREGSWQMGVGTTFDLETGAGDPTSHLQFLARVPMGPHVAWCVRVLWPLLAAQFRNNGNDVRAWTFVGSVSLQYAFASGRRLRPFLGLSLGTRLGLTELTPLTASQSGESFTTSGTFGIEAGVRYSLGPVLQLFFQVEAARNWLLPPDANASFERAPANGETARAAIGIMFES
jgi:hypothetical protein